MKKVKLGFLSFALILGIGAALATSNKGTSGKLANFNWQTVDPATGALVTVANGGVYDPDRSIAQAKSDYGCSGAGSSCAAVVSSQDTPPSPGAMTIKRN